MIMHSSAHALMNTLRTSGGSGSIQSGRGFRQARASCCELMSPRVHWHTYLDFAMIDLHSIRVLPTTRAHCTKGVTVRMKQMVCSLA